MIRASAGETDLFGSEVMQRSAQFVGGARVELHRRWGPGPRACVIGHNSSDAGAEAEDPTTKWWNRWFRHFGFGSYTAVNLYPFVTPDPRKCYEVVDRINAGLDWAARDLLHFVNLSAVVEAAKGADQVFVCFGNIARHWEWIEHVVEEIQTGVEPWPDLWCWGKTKSGAPTHPMARGKHRIAWDAPAQLWRAKS